MREIKFRSWDKIRKVMIGSDYPQENYDDWESEWFGKVSEMELTSIESINNNNQFELMQYTGLKDINGVEIYEGDIVKCVYDKAYSNIGILHAVTYDNQISGFLPFTDYNTTHNYFNFPKFFAIIGNIYQNPELLE